MEMIFCFDIDGIIAEKEQSTDYSFAQPIQQNITLINKLYNSGHRIILFTARGSVTGINWTNVTKKQLKEWNVNYHELHFNKPFADYYIDDRFIDVNELREIYDK